MNGVTPPPGPSPTPLPPGPGPTPVPESPTPAPPPILDDGVFLYEANEVGGQIFLPPAAFVKNAHRNGALAWEVCLGGTFDNGHPVWTQESGSNVGSFGVTGHWGLRMSTKCGLHFSYNTSLPISSKVYTAADDMTSFDQGKYLEVA